MGYIGVKHEKQKTGIFSPDPNRSGLVKNVRFSMGVHGIFCSRQRPGYI